MSVGTVQRVAWGPEAYASFWQRLGALLLDGLIVGAVGLVFVGLLTWAVVVTEGNAFAIVLLVLAWLAWIVGAYAYEAILVNRRGATIGKAVVGIEVRAADGGLPSVGQSWGRVLARTFLSGFFFLGYLWMLWDDQRRTWHDLICGTYVVDGRRVTAADGPGGPHPVYGMTYQGWGAQPQPTWGQPQPQPTWGQQPPPQPTWGRPPEAPSTADAAPTSGLPARPPTEASGDLPSLETAGPQDPQPQTQPGTWTTPGPQADAVAEPTPTSGGEPTAPGSQPGPDQGLGSPAPAAADPNVVAVDRAGLAPESVEWLHQVAAQVDQRLDRVNPGWRQSTQAEAARACAFGLLLGRLAATY
ncbi:MAG: RDD family protein, partial [Actinomycetota bacterium]|nr:RDD family protein [Actinomycetota bacterium]